MDDLTRTARTTGGLYLLLALTGLLGFLVVRSQLYLPDDASATLANLVEHEGLARAGIALELGVVVSQALVAVWFYRLFRPHDGLAAGSIAAFGLANAVTVLVNAAFLATALDVALDGSLAVGGDGEATAQLMYVVAGHLWGVGAIFFGLWLIPMGLCVLRTGTMPRPLGWLLMGGGVGYVLSAFTAFLVPDADVLVTLMTVPASVGEFWIVGYLLVRGVGRARTASSPSPRVSEVTHTLFVYSRSVPYSEYVPTVCKRDRRDPMTWTSFRRRGEILRAVIATADVRRDGILPMDVDGVAETFGDELTLLGALQLRWHTRLAGRIERELMNQPMDLEQAVVTAWRATADEMPGALAVIDHYRAEPRTTAMADAMATSAAKERTLLAVMAGRAGAQDAAAPRVGLEIENRARATYVPSAPAPAERPQSGLLDRIKAVLAA